VLWVWAAAVREFRQRPASCGRIGRFGSHSFATAFSQLLPRIACSRFPGFGDLKKLNSIGARSLRASRIARTLASDQSNERFNVLTNPVEDLGKVELVALHRAHDERISIRTPDVEVKAVAPQEDIGSGEGDAFVAI